ncbi:MAG: phosphoenolpyruvate kinase [Ignavibacteriales bacterium]|nr:phosphoenolpyruvate kinase [Ignavibacteriales bacterium]
MQKTPVEDYRIDFEDGYGYRTDEEENNHAITAATAAAGLILAKKTPEYFGFRVKPLTPATLKRSLMTMEMFLTQLAKGLDGYIPEGFLITLPKVETISQVNIFNTAIDMVLQKNGWPAGTLRTEIMIETPSAILTQQGMANLPLLIEAAGDRLFAVHAGLYDFTGALDIAATDQMYQHQYCNFLRFMMLVSANNAGVHVSDGATSFLPVEKYKKPENSEQSNENKRIVWKAWRLHFDNVLHSLAMGIVQGWDLHPGQIPARLAAVYYYYRKDKDKLMSRFFNFVKSAAQATQQSGNFDDAATGQGMLNFLLKGYECGALNDGDFAGYGINPESLKSRSFPKICEAFNNKKSN